MTQEDKNRIITLLKNYNNVSLLIADLLNPINDVMKKYQCSTEEACNIKFKAEDYLKNYGCLTIDSTTKAVKNIVESIKVEEKIETPVPTDAR